MSPKDSAHRERSVNETFRSKQSTVTLALISFGANLGTPAETYDQVRQALRSQPRHRLVADSGLIRTRPIGGPSGQPPFGNAALLVETATSIVETWEMLRKLEQQLGRTRNVRWEARVVDLDLLLFGDQVLTTEFLVVPHPRLTFRRFVLEPAVTIAADMQHPELQLTLGQLVEHLDKAPPYVAVLAEHPSAAQRLIKDVCASGTHVALLAADVSESAAGGVAPAGDRGRAATLLRAAIDQLPSENAYVCSDLWFPSTGGPGELASVNPDIASNPIPRLIVILDDPQTSSTPSSRSAIYSRAVAHSPGPVLYLAGGDRQQQRHEFGAAMEAMGRLSIIA